MVYLFVCTALEPEWQHSLHIVPKATQIVSHSLGENLVLPACVTTTIRCEGVRV